jgi:hypothetical protein
VGHPKKKLAVSLIALVALVTLFATLSAAAQEPPGAGSVIIDRATVPSR